MDSKNLRQYDRYIFGGLTVITLGVVAYNYITRNDKRTQAEIDNWRAITEKVRATAFNPNWYKTAESRDGHGTSCRMWNNEFNEKMAKQIYDANGFWRDNETSAIAVIRAAPSKIHISRLAEVFQQLYKKDLLTFMKSFMLMSGLLPTNYMDEVYQIAYNLPNCTTK